MSAASSPARRRRATRVLPGFLDVPRRDAEVRTGLGRRPPAGSGEAEVGDGGALTLMLAVLFVALLALAGLVVDGGAKLDADQKATAIAQEAARAGAGMVDLPRAYAGGPFTVSPAQAILAARQYLTAAGYPGSLVSLAGNDAIRVTVTIRQPTLMLSVIGIDSFTVQGTATASLVSGVTGPGH